MSLEKKNDLHWNMPGISQGGGDPRMSLGCEWRRRRKPASSIHLLSFISFFGIDFDTDFFFSFFSITFISLVRTQESNKFKFKFKKKKKKERKKERKREKKKKRKEKDEVITACGRPRSREHPRGWPSSQRKGLGAEGQPRARRPAKLQKKKKRV